MTGIYHVLLIAVFTAFASASGFDKRVVLYERTGVPADWSEAHGQTSSAAESETLHLAVLPLRHNTTNIQLLKARGAELFSPHSALRELGVTEIDELTSPLPGCRSVVNQWQQECGVRDQQSTHYHDALMLEITAAQIKCLFHATMTTFMHNETSMTKTIAFGAVSLPNHVHECVEFVAEISDLPTVKRHHHKAKGKKADVMHTKVQSELGNVSLDLGVMSPETLAKLYNVQPHLYQRAPSTVVVAEFLGELGVYADYDTADLVGGGHNHGFFNLSGLQKPSGKIVHEGKASKGSDKSESSLDVEYALSTSRGGMVYWNEARWMYPFAVSLNSYAQIDEIGVVSISFEWSENNQCTEPNGKTNPTCADLKVTSAGYVARTNIEFLKLAAKGVTVVVSSGDDGVLGNAKGCKDQRFSPQFPASSPYVLTVGATMLKRNSARKPEPTWKQGCPDVRLKKDDFCDSDAECGHGASYCSNGACDIGCGDGPCKGGDFGTCFMLDKTCGKCMDSGKWGKTCGGEMPPSLARYGNATSPSGWCPSAICAQNGGCAVSTQDDEIACSLRGTLITSGGGFSEVEPRPSWQDSAVKEYLAKANLPPSALWNNSGRAYPDVSLVGYHYPAWAGGTWLLLDGTSASTPVLAGLVALMKPALIEAGCARAKLGLMNEILYAAAASHKDAFHDVVEGSNECKSSTDNCCGPHGFHAASGWDPVTGVGSPNIDNLIKYIIADVCKKEEHLVV